MKSINSEIEELKELKKVSIEDNNEDLEIVYLDRIQQTIKIRDFIEKELDIRINSIRNDKDVYTEEEFKLLKNELNGIKNKLLGGNDEN